MPTIGEIYYDRIKNCKDFGISSADIRLLIAHNEGLFQQIDVIFHQNDEMKHLKLFNEQYERLKRGEPVEYIIEEAEFLGLKLHVDRRVLIPRGETEELVALLSERASDYFDPRNYLVCADIGTGSGAITLGVKSAFPNWVMVATDIDKDAMDVAKENFAHYGVKVDTYLGDSLQPLIDKNIKADILISNPPYIVNENDAQPSVKDYEPAKALWLSEANDVYEKIFQNVDKVRRGFLLMLFEISPDLKDRLTFLMEKYLQNYNFEFIQDLGEFDRFLLVSLEDENE